MASNTKNQLPSSSLVTEQPTLYYLSWGLRMLSDVASHVQRCSRCYAVEEENEHIGGGWAIATPNGVIHTSIVNHPMYMEITRDSSYFCLKCFKEHFGATMVPSSLLDEPSFKEDLPSLNSQRFLTNKGIQVSTELEKMRHVLENKRIHYGGSSSREESFTVIPYLPSGFEVVGVWGKDSDITDLLISVPTNYLNGSTNTDVIKEVHNNKAIEMKFDESVCKYSEIEMNSRNKGSYNIIKESTKSDFLAQGQRCSRTNGRGWKCQKITLLGYALCEYHLALARSRTIENKLKI